MLRIARTDKRMAIEPLIRKDEEPMSTTTPEQETTTQDSTEQLQFLDVYEGDQTLKVELRAITDEERTAAMTYANAVYAKMKAGYKDPISGENIQRPTKDNMMEFGKQLGLWSDKDEIDYTSLNNQIEEKEKRLVAGRMNLKEGYQLAMELVQHRQDITPFNWTRERCFSETADHMADLAFNKYVVVCIARYVADGSRVFKDIKDFENPLNVKSKQVMDHYVALDRFFRQMTSPAQAEVQFFREMEFIDDQGNIYDFARENVVRNLWQSIPELEEKVEPFSGFYDDEGNPVLTRSQIVKQAKEAEEKRLAEEQQAAQVPDEERPFDVGGGEVVVNGGV